MKNYLRLAGVQRVFVWALALLILTGCGHVNREEYLEREAKEKAEKEKLNPKGSAEVPGSFAVLEEVEYRLKDGRKVTCLVFHGDRQGGLSCDWAR